MSFLGLSPDAWTALGTWALALVGGAAAWAAYRTLRQIGRQTDTLVAEAQQMAGQTEAMRKQADLMARQWEDERALHLRFSQGPMNKEYVGSLDPAGTASPGTWRVHRAILSVRNYGQRAIHVTGLEFLAPGGGGSTVPKDIGIAADADAELDITEELVTLVAGPSPPLNLAALEHLQSTYFKARVHCNGLGGAKPQDVSFQVTYVGSAKVPSFRLTVL